MIWPKPLLQSKQVLWKSLFSFTIGAAYFYVFMEWLFFVTKPSFMDLMGWAEKLETLLLSGLVVAITGGVLLLICMGADILLSRTRFTTLSPFVATIIPTVILSATCLLMVDNFTYTVFKWGVVSTEGVWREAYGLGSLTLLCIIFIKDLEFLGLRGNQKPPRLTSRIPLLLTTGLLVISSVLALVRFSVAYFGKNVAWTNPQGGLTGSARRPNIILIGGDGMSAANLSAYGYERDTTPILSRLAALSLLAENAFANSGHSAGSVISIFTSKPPTRTRVLYPPDILKGSDAYQHLPGILRIIGYHTVEIGVPYYVDAFNMNMLEGFDIVNQSSYKEGEVIKFARRLGYSDSVYFVSQSIERLVDRLLYIFFIKEMENPYAIVTQSINSQSDRERLTRLKELIRDTDQPLFVHIHMMDTHGAKFVPEQQVFSKGKAQDENWMTDFYDDGILSFDHDIGELLYSLKEFGKLDNTILIIYSDHAERYDIRVRIPLLIHFPGNAFAGRIQANVQNLDIAPTILDYLDLPVPVWMEGKSLLRANLPVHRLIFSSNASFTVELGEGIFIIDPKRIKPPFYQFMSLNLVDCSNWYRLKLLDFELTSGQVAGHTAPCAETSMLTLDQARAEMVKYLSSNGFDTSKLP